MGEYYLTAAKASDRGWLGGLVFIELHSRIHGGKFGVVPKPLSDDAFKSYGYCIDAPDLLPAGACESFPIDAETSIPAQLTVERETP